MTNAQYEDFVQYDLMNGWVPLRNYCRLFGETSNAVQLRITRGLWDEGVHYARRPGADTWVNLIRIREWLEGKVPVPAPEILGDKP